MKKYQVYKQMMKAVLTNQIYLPTSKPIIGIDLAKGKSISVKVTYQNGAIVKTEYAS